MRTDWTDERFFRGVVLGATRATGFSGFLLFFVCAAAIADAQDGLSPDGTEFHLGTTDENPLWDGEAGAVLSVQDTSAGANAIRFLSNRLASQWLWITDGSEGSMLLDEENTLTLFDLTGAPNIILSPTGGVFGEAGTAPVILIDGAAVVTEASLPVLLPGAIGEGLMPANPASLSYGTGNTVTGQYAFAGGQLSTAAGTHSVALGYDADATHADGSYALGYNVLASGKFSLAMGHNTKARSAHSVAIGVGSKATAPAATALGRQTTADGSAATAMGWNTTALGVASTATGQATVAAADTSTATGLGTIAQGHSQFVIGAFNEASGDAAIRNTFDEALILGNGESDGARSTSFSVSWAGDVHARGGIRADGPAVLSFVPPQGDLSMGEFTTLPANNGGGTQ